VDARLWSIAGKHVETLKQPDLPDLAKAICAYMRHLGVTVHAGQAHNIGYVQFQAINGSFSVVVRQDDWSKIVPYLQSGQLDPPPETLLPWRNGTVELGNIAVFDSYYYNRVLGVLRGLFPVTFPTSYL
jgi:hypothetical protein